MRLDLYLSRVGIAKRRTVAKEMAASGLIKINGNRAKPSGSVKVGDIVMISGSRSMRVEVRKIPTGNVKKEDREDYFKQIG